MKTFRISDKVSVKIDGVEFKVSPLSFEKRTEVQTEVLNAQKNANPLGLVNAARLAMKYGIKEQSGITYYDGSKFELAFDEQGYLTDECLDELLNADSDDKLQMLCMTLAKGIPSVPVDNDGKPIEGVIIEKAEKTPEKK